jgi:hypothetical protein
LVGAVLRGTAALDGAVCARVARLAMPATPKTVVSVRTATIIVRILASSISSGSGAWSNRGRVR